VNTQSIYDLVAQKVSGSSQSQQYTDSFFHALRRTLSDLRYRVGVTIATVSDPSQDLVCDDEYYSAIVLGVMLYIQDTGFWGVDKDVATLRQDYYRELRSAKVHYDSTQTIYTRSAGAATSSDDDE
jgi:hypothetical protein